jgi:hypothetical protein
MAEIQKHMLKMFIALRWGVGTMHETGLSSSILKVGDMAEIVRFQKSWGLEPKQ